MSKRSKSARGEIVDFDLLAIKQHLATTPAPISVENRRKFIDEKDGLKTRESYIVHPVVPVDDAAVQEDSPLSVAAESAKASKLAKK